MPTAKSIVLSSKTVKNVHSAHSTRTRNHIITKRNGAYGALKNSVRIKGNIISRVGVRWSADAV